MTGTEVDVESQAQRLAARGRDALVQRMRGAYSDAAAAHADLISLDDERIEAMVQAAADRADGLQWRRALATVAADELGLSPTEALAHPAVARAQSLVGAPSYEQSLAEMIARPVPLPGLAAVPEPEPQPQPPLPEPTPEPPAPEPEPDPEPVPGPAVDQTGTTDEPGPVADTGSTEAEHSDELETVQADDTVLELLPEPDPIEYETEAYDVEASFAQEQVPPAPTNPFAVRAEQPAEERDEEHQHAPETAQYAALATVADEQSAAHPSEPLQTQEEVGTEITIPAIHLGGVANLPTKREGLSVRLSADGLDIMQGPSDIIGRLVWDEIEALEVPHLRVRRRSKQLRARLVVRTPHGDASFEVPDVSGDDLRERVAPLMQLYGRH